MTLRRERSTGLKKANPAGRKDGEERQRTQAEVFIAAFRRGPAQPTLISERE